MRDGEGRGAMVAAPTEVTSWRHAVGTYRMEHAAVSALWQGDVLPACACVLLRGGATPRSGLPPLMIWGFLLSSCACQAATTQEACRAASQKDALSLHF